MERTIWCRDPGDKNLKGIHIPIFDPKPTPNYPSEWFARNEGKKPMLMTPATELNLDQLRQLLINNIASERYNVNIAIAYLYALFQANKARLDEPWTSFGRKIGETGQEVGISDIMDVTHYECVLTKDKMVNTKHNDKWLAMCATAPYRVASEEDIQNYNPRNRAARPSYRLMKPGDNTVRWLDDTNYVKLIAAIDMFLVKFPKHEFNQVRNQTMRSRFKHCAVLVAVHEFKKFTGLTTQKMSDWIWMKSLRKEFKMFNDDEEIYKIDSYTPYMMDMQLSKKSPYSTTVNPHLHNFIHIVGTTYGRTASKNAKLFDINIPIKNNAMILAYALDKISDFSPYDGKTPENPFGRHEHPVVGEPKSTDAKEWYSYFRSLNGSMPIHIEEKSTALWRNLEDLKTDTVGMYLYSL